MAQAMEKFEKFLELPSELILAITDTLDPQTLSNLSRTSKPMHTFLLPSLQQSARENAVPDKEEFEARLETGPNGKISVAPITMDGTRPRERFAAAVVEKKYDAVKFLLDAGVDPNSSTVFGHRMLSLALWDDKGRLSPILDLLLEYGADPALPNIRDCESTPLLTAATTGNSAIIQKLIRARPYLDGPGLIHTIVRFCDLNTIRLAIAYGADLRLRRLINNETVLQWALESRHPDVFPFMLRQVPDLISAQDITGKSLLWRVLGRQSMSQVQMLVDVGIDLNLQNQDNDTALHVAIRMFLPKPALLFIERGIIVGIHGRGGLTELHHAANTGLIEVVSPLLARGGVDINAQTNDLETPLHFAVDKGYDTVVRKLVENGADASIRDIRGRTPADLAVFRRRNEIYRWLKQHTSS